MFTLSAGLLFVIGIVVMLLAEGAKAICQKYNKKLDKFWVSIVLMVLSFIMALVFFQFTLPALPVWSDWTAVQAWSQALILVVAAICGFAFMIYNLFIGKLKGKLTDQLDGGDITPVALPDEINTADGK